MSVKWNSEDFKLICVCYCW